MSLVLSVKQFLRWWRGALLQGLPGFLRKRSEKTVLRISDKRIYLPVAGQSVAYDLPQDLISEMNHACKRVVVEIDAMHCFSLEFQIPRAAASDLENIIAYEFDKLTPFSRESVFYRYSIDGVDKSGLQLVVHLLAVKKELLEPLLAQLKQHAYELVALCPMENPGINLLPQNLRAKETGRLEKAVYFVSVILFLCAAIVPLWQKQQLSAVLAAENSALETALEAKEKQHTKSRKAMQAVDTLWARKRANTGNIVLLNDLSILIPHDTFLQRLQRKGNKLTLKGESASASSLIEQLEASPLLSEVRFSSAVTQLPGSDRERFAITAVVSAER